MQPPRNIVEEAEGFFYPRLTIVSSGFLELMGSV
jgi:hypothetical protein